ncbi:hypothetical protein [Paracoccus sp. JM45]|uniref:hypothetical protein n=1 Tax=Paracoccus sp. JM45 TaxID=2283626 RepID=UPI000E6CFFC8|nr:hypothetical protein [Paracoccus sp. JM45]RJE78812.1 hypothetical protein DWB67_15565 [Paracoccus sp. JM45]
MEQPTGEGPYPSSPLIIRVEFTIEMLRNLLVVFEATSDGGSLDIELRESGIWVLTPEGHPLFIGPMTQSRSYDA